MNGNFERKVLGGLGLASVIIASVTVVYHYSSERLVESAGRVGETHALISGLSDFEARLQTSRMATRGYLVTGDDGVRRLFQWARNESFRALAALNEASIGDGQQRKAVDEINRLARERLRISDELIERREEQGAATTPEVLAQWSRDDINDPLRDRVEKLLNATRMQLGERQALARDNSAAMFWLLLFGAVVELAFAIAATGVIRRYIRDGRAVVEDLRRSEATLRGFYESGVTMMGIVETLEDEKDIEFISANSATSRLFSGRPVFSGNRASEMGSPPHLIAMFLQRFRQALRENGPVQFEYERMMPGGKRWITVVICPIAGKTSRPRFSYVMVDQTERKQAEAALRQHAEELALAKGSLEQQSAALHEARQAADAANAAKSNFLANMSHEIRTPMTAVVGYADLLADPTRGDEKRGDWVGVIRRNARHLLELINDILDLSKIEAGKMTMEMIACDPAQIASDITSMLRPRAQQKGIELRLDIEGPLPRDVASDPMRLRQILLNLVGNAVKFTDAGEVHVRVHCEVHSGVTSSDDACTLHIDVRDTGIGMSPRHLERLFKPFTQADETTTRRFGGTGLGLAISQRLVMLLGGTMTVQSEEGIGSTFSITLPVRIPTADQEAAADDAAPLLYGQTDEPVELSGRILVAEDTIDTQRLLSIVLTAAGAEIVLVADGQAAVDVAASEEFDVILMDMQMPRMDGYSATRELRKRGCETPIIALTGHAMGADREKCLAAGCSDYLSKPIDVPVLLATLARHLQSARRQPQVA